MQLAGHAKRGLGPDEDLHQTASAAREDGDESPENIAASQRLIGDLIDRCTQPQDAFSMEWLGKGDIGFLRGRSIYMGFGNRQVFSSIHTILASALSRPGDLARHRIP